MSRNIYNGKQAVIKQSGNLFNQAAKGVENVAKAANKGVKATGKGISSATKQRKVFTNILAREKLQKTYLQVCVNFRRISL